MSHTLSGDCFAGACEICNPPKQSITPNATKLEKRIEELECWKADMKAMYHRQKEQLDKLEAEKLEASKGTAPWYSSYKELEAELDRVHELLELSTQAYRYT